MMWLELVIAVLVGGALGIPIGYFQFRVKARRERIKRQRSPGPLFLTQRN